MFSHCNIPVYSTYTHTYLQNCLVAPSLYTVLYHPCIVDLIVTVVKEPRVQDRGAYARRCGDRVPGAGCLHGTCTEPVDRARGPRSSPEYGEACALSYRRVTVYRRSDDRHPHAPGLESSDPVETHRWSAPADQVDPARARLDRNPVVPQALRAQQLGHKLGFCVHLDRRCGLLFTAARLVVVGHAVTAHDISVGSPVATR